MAKKKKTTTKRETTMDEHDDETADNPSTLTYDNPPPASAPAQTPREVQEATPPQPAYHPPAAQQPTLDDHIDEAVEDLRGIDDQRGPDDIHPDIKLPMCLIRDKPRMVRYAQALGANKQAAQSRREKIKLTREVMFLYKHYRTYCERHGLRYWTERGFAATLVCYHRGVPLYEPEHEPEQDILNRLSAAVKNEQDRKRS